MKSANDVRNYVKQTLGTSAGVSKFAEAFVNYRKLETKQEPESVNTYASAPVPDKQPKPQEAKKKVKGKKKLDPNLLGFSVSSNRIMQGEIESPDT